MPSRSGTGAAVRRWVRAAVTGPVPSPAVLAEAVPSAVSSAVAAAVVPMVVVSLVVLPASPAGAGQQRVDEGIAAATAAFGRSGVVGIAVARVQTPAAGLTLRGAEARALRLAAARAGNAAADRTFPTASMVKLFLAEDLLHRYRAGAVTLDRGERELVERMITRSDDPAASTLWDRYDGERMVRDVAARYGLTGTAPPRVAGQWGEATTTAVDLASFLGRLPVVAHPDDAAALLGWMRAATPIAADGFDQRFGLFGTVPGTPAVKQGWMCCVAGARHLHSVAVVGSEATGRYEAVVLLGEVPRSVGWAAARAALDAAAAALPVSPRGTTG